MLKSMFLSSPRKPMFAAVRGAHLAKAAEICVFLWPKAHKGVM